MAATNNSSIHVPTYLPEHLPVLDVIFPGFSLASSSAQHLLSGDLNSYAVVLCAFGVFTFLWKYLSNFVRWVQSNLTSTVHVSSSSEAHGMLLVWMSTHNVGNTSRSSIARIGTGKTLSIEPVAAKKKPLHFSPWKGSFFFQYQWSILFRSTLNDTPFRQEEVSLTCLGRSPTIIHRLLLECREEYLRQTRDKTTIFKHYGTYWSRATTVAAKPVSTVMLDVQEKKSLIKDMEAFLLERTRQWHAARSLPYRRGFMFHGPPGTGKSSLSLAIAGHLELDIYSVNLMTVDNDSLGSLFSALPPKCIVLVEDVDAADATSRRDMKKTPGGTRKGLTLSSLLNALDGVSSQEGRILIMTTNHIEKLDEALIRPGRIDKTVRFRLADADILQQLFCLVFKQTNEEVKDHVQRVKINAQVEHQATEFATKIPHERLTPAEVLSFLLPLRDCPASALDKAQEWAARAMREKGRILEEDSLANEDQGGSYQRITSLISHPASFFALSLVLCIVGGVAYGCG
ncbi:P-loop containing nucleoside triphosphate hydrolase protein [Xylaria sp. FL1042]|nr:P-loop containing nucleoside triphosphate hydrolase protein [Xylaria sp. FL1042]